MSSPGARPRLIAAAVGGFVVCRLLQLWWLQPAFYMVSTEDRLRGTIAQEILRDSAFHCSRTARTTTRAVRS